MRLSLQVGKPAVGTSCEAGKLRDRGSKMRTDTKQEHCPCPFVDPAQAQQ